MGTFVSVIKPVLFSVMGSCHTKLLVVELLQRYAKTTDNDIDDLLAQTVKTALLRDCK